MVSRSVTLMAAMPLQRQRIAASKGRSNDTGGEDREPGCQEIVAERSAETNWDLLWMIRLSVQPFQFCVVFKFGCGA